MVHPQPCISRPSHTAAAFQLLHVLCLTTQRCVAKTDGTIDRVANDTDGTAEDTKRAKDTDGSAKPTKGAADNTNGDSTENMNRETMEKTDGGAMQTVDRLPDATNGIAHTMDDGATVEDGGATEDTDRGVHVPGTRERTLGIQCRSMHG